MPLHAAFVDSFCKSAGRRWKLLWRFVRLRHVLFPMQSFAIPYRRYAARSRGPQALNDEEKVIDLELALEILLRAFVAQYRDDYESLCAMFRWGQAGVRGRGWNGRRTTVRRDMGCGLPQGSAWCTKPHVALKPQPVHAIHGTPAAWQVTPTRNRPLTCATCPTPDQVHVRQRGAQAGHARRPGHVPPPAVVR